MVLNPPQTITETHLTLLLWKKLLGHNQGGITSSDYNYLLEEYAYKCSNGIPQNQIERIQDVEKSEIVNLTGIILKQIKKI